MGGHTFESPRELDILGSAADTITLFNEPTTAYRVSQTGYKMPTDWVVIAIKPDRTQVVLTRHPSEKQALREADRLTAIAKIRGSAEWPSYINVGNL